MTDREQLKIERANLVKLCEDYNSAELSKRFNVVLDLLGGNNRQALYSELEKRGIGSASEFAISEKCIVEDSQNNPKAKDERLFELSRFLLALQSILKTISTLEDSLQND